MDRTPWLVVAIVAENGLRGASRSTPEAGEIYFSCQAKSGMDQFWLPDAIPKELSICPFPTFSEPGSPLPAFLLYRSIDDGCCRVSPELEGNRPAAWATSTVTVHATRYAETVTVIDGMVACATQPALADFHMPGDSALMPGGE